MIEGRGHIHPLPSIHHLCIYVNLSPYTSTLYKMFKLELDEELLNKISKWIGWGKRNLSSISLLCVSIALVYQTRQLSASNIIIKQKDIQLQQLEDLKHKEDREDKIFWRTSYFNLLEILKDNDQKINFDSLSHASAFSEGG